MISAYGFSLTGRDHIKYNMPCHDYSLVKEISPAWKIAVVADGVGSCSHAEIASKIAAEAVADLIYRQFPPFCSDAELYKSVILASMNGAANAIENYVMEHDEGNELEYQTTLAVAVMSKNSLFYGNAGDSGIIALDDSGFYHLLTEKQNDDIGRVFSIPAHRNFSVGKADFTPVSVLCMTDGVLDYIAPPILADQENKIDVPFANFFISYAFGLAREDESEAVEKCKEKVIRYLSSEQCAKMTDDLSVVAMTITDSYLELDDIVWEKPDIDYYLSKWNECSLYPNAQIKLFTDYVKEKNPDWSDSEISAFIKKYTSSGTEHEENDGHEGSEEDTESVLSNGSENDTQQESTDCDDVAVVKGFREKKFKEQKEKVESTVQSVVKCIKNCMK